MSDTKSRIAPQQVHFISLGCPKNQVDTEIMLGVSQGEGLRVTNEPEAADVIVVNTCGFIDAAKQESIDTILEMAEYKNSGVCKKLVVTGCLSQRYSAELAEAMPEVDHFLGSSDMMSIAKILNAQHGHRAERMMVGTPSDYIMKASDPRVLSGTSYSAYLKIAEGCNRKCSFCAIPGFRGKQRSRSIDDIVREAKQLVAQGVVELNVIAQDTMSFGHDAGREEDLPKLLEALGSISNLGWLRLFYLYPDKLDVRLIQAFQNVTNLLPYLDMPLQHASENMLKRMRRGVRAGGQKRVVDILKQTFPTATLRTSFIVGHPGETEEDFETLLDFVAWAEFDRVGVFVYSHEEGTHSATMYDEVPKKTAEQRFRQLMALQKKISRKKLKALKGQTLEMIIEGPSDESEFLLKGRHKGQAPDIDGHAVLSFSKEWIDTYGEALAITPGTRVLARVTATTDYDLVAEMIQCVQVPQRAAPLTGQGSEKRRLSLLH